MGVTKQSLSRVLAADNVFLETAEDSDRTAWRSSGTITYIIHKKIGKKKKHVINPVTQSFS